MRVSECGEVFEQMLSSDGFSHPSACMTPPPQRTHSIQNTHDCESMQRAMCCWSLCLFFLFALFQVAMYDHAHTSAHSVDCCHIGHSEYFISVFFEHSFVSTRREEAVGGLPRGGQGKRTVKKNEGESQAPVAAAVVVSPSSA